ncbi:MAG: hypothetical protein ACRD2H_15185 [Terriglobales bacterium]
MASVKLNFPMESLQQWGDRLGIPKARRRVIERIVAPRRQRAYAKGLVIKASPKQVRLARRKAK